MATRTASLQAILELLQDIGLAPETVLDSDEDPGPFTLSGWDESRRGEVKVAASADDQALTFTNIIAAILVSEKPFKLRHAAGETLLANLRCYLVWADDTDDHIASTSVLLSGNGTDQAIVRYFLIEKP